MNNASIAMKVYIDSIRNHQNLLKRLDLISAKLYLKTRLIKDKYQNGEPNLVFNQFFLLKMHFKAVLFWSVIGFSYDEFGLFVFFRGLKNTA